MDETQTTKPRITLVPLTKHIGAYGLLLLILIVGGWIRIQGIPHLPTRQFASNDAYLYYSHADTIVKEGTLPKMETHRWVPLGRDLTETLHGYPYILAYVYKAIALFFPNVTLYEVQRVAPTVCFLIGTAVLCVFLYARFGLSVALIVGVLLAVMPGSIERTSAGFSDRDGWCWLLGVLAVTLYLCKEHTPQKWSRYVYTVLSGVFVFIGGLSWEGFGGFVMAISAVELWRFLITDTEEHLQEYVVWVLMFVPWLYLLCPAYRSGGGFSSHVTVFLLSPPLVILALRALRYYLTRGHRFTKFLAEQVSARAISLVLCAVCLLIGIAYLFFQRETFTQSIVPFSDADVMETIGELRSPPDVYWYHRYGGVLFLASSCLIIGTVKLWGKQALLLTATLGLFTASTFLRQYLYHVLSPVVCEYIFYGAVAFTPIAALSVAVRRASSLKHESTYIAMSTWLLLWIGLARDSQRYDFFVGVPLAFFSAVAIQFIATRLAQRVKTPTKTDQMENSAEALSSNAIKKKRHARKRKHKQPVRKLATKKPLVNLLVPFTPQIWIKTGILLVGLALLLFWEPPGSSARYGLALRGHATQISPEVVFPGKETPMANACQWLRTHYARDAVVATAWSHGNYLNALGGVKTIIDADHYIMHWIDLYEAHVAAAQSEREALEFLKTHRATHLLLTEEDVLYTTSKHTHANEQPDAPHHIEPLISCTPIGNSDYQMVPIHKNAFVTTIDIDFHHTPPVVTAHLKNKETVKLPYIKYFGESKETTHNIHTHASQVSAETAEDRKIENKNGGILHHFNAKTKQDYIYYLSPRSWNSLAVKLFLRGEHSNAFVQVYPENDDTTTEDTTRYMGGAVKIWEIRYPPDVVENPKYLETIPERKDTRK